MEKKIVSLIVVLGALTAFLWNKDDMLIQKQVARFYETAAASAQAVMLRDMDTGEILYQKNPGKRISIGSINKVLTTCIAMEHLDWDDILTVGEEIDEPYLTKAASRSQLQKGEQLTFRQLMTAILLPSGCDAVNTVAVTVVRKIKNAPAMEPGKALRLFCSMMNTYAKKLGCTNSHFVNPDGQDDERQYTCVKDMLLFINKAMENETFREIVAKAYVDARALTGQKHQWSSTNQLLHPSSPYYYEYALGIKTGYTDAAGFAMSSYAKKDGRTLMVIACECTYEWQRYTIASNLLKLGFMSYYQNR